MKKKYYSLVFLAFVLFAILLTRDKSSAVMKSIFTSASSDGKQITIVVDPGHGGRDPGKVGVNNVLEKDINLSISLLLKSKLEEAGVNVIMTRDADVGLYSDDDSNKKTADMNNRVKLINSSDVDFAISIHQNSFTQETAKGAQVFYHGNSEEGKKLALLLQKQMIDTMEDGNKRAAKANESYYMLKKSVCPLVIVECGYLSNRTEADLLLKPEYQEKLVEGIYLGIMRYIDGETL